MSALFFVLSSSTSLSHVYYMWDWTTLLPPAGAPGYCCGSVRTTQFKYLWNLSPFVVETYKYKSILFLTFSIILFAIVIVFFVIFCPFAAVANTFPHLWGLYASKSIQITYKQHIKQTQTGTNSNWSSKGTFFNTRGVFETTFSW